MGYRSDDIVIMAFLLAICLIFLALILSILGKRAQLRRYKKIRIGMPESTMRAIMGNGYDISSLKNNRSKYEWRINASSFSSHGVRAYSGVSKVEIYVKDGVVEEIKPYNVR